MTQEEGQTVTSFSATCCRPSEWPKEAFGLEHKGAASAKGELSAGPVCLSERDEQERVQLPAAELAVRAAGLQGELADEEVHGPCVSVRLERGSLQTRRCTGPCISVRLERGSLDAQHRVKKRRKT